MIAIDHVGQITSGLIPELLFECCTAFFEERLPTRRKLRANRERVQPERLNLHRLANTWRNFAAIDSRVHPSELLAVFASRKQTVLVGANAEARPFIVTRENRFHRR